MDDLENLKTGLDLIHKDFERFLDSVDEETTIAFARDVRSYYDQHLSTADTKASSILALALPAIAVLIHFGSSGWQDIARWGGVASLFLGIIFALLAIQPRRFIHRETPVPGFIFWENLKGYKSLDEYTLAFAALDGPGIIAAYSKQHFAVAWTLTRKYRWLHLSVPAVVLGLVLTAVSLAIP
jgi:hypothetical protein